MSLATAMGISTSALSLAQDGITTSSHNLANINTPGYVKQTNNQESVVINGIGQGAQVTGMSANVAAELYNSIRNQVSSLGNTGALNTYYDAIQRLYGQPNSDTGLSSAINAFFSAYQNLSNNPDTASLRVVALNAARDLAGAISTTANSLQDLRFSADKEISSNVNTINSILTTIRGLNNEILNFKEATSGYINIKQQMNIKLNALSEFLNVSTSVNLQGQVSITTANGASLLDDATTVNLLYSPAASVDTFKNNAYVGPLKATSLNNDGSIKDDRGSSTNLTTDGESTSITTTLTNGSMKGLLDIRDSIAPNLIAQLDTLASALANEINAISNNGYAFPPPASLTGTTATTSDTELGFTGKVMIAVLNNDGTPAASRYSDETYYRPLTLDLGSLSGATYSGLPTTQDVIDQINDYYGPIQNRAVVGNLRNIQLSAVSNTIGDNTGTAQFELKLDNTSIHDATVVVQSVTLVDPGNPATTYGPGSAVPSPNSFTIAAGEMGATGQPMTIDFSGGLNLNNYTIRVRVQVTDSTGSVSVSDVDYSVNDNVVNVKNNPYNAIAVANISGTSNFIPSPGGQGFATASLVDINGNPVSAGETGFLKITANSEKNYRIAFDELDSKEIGVPTADSEDITNRGFSHYFGLNNLFVDNGSVTGSAQNMAVRRDILNNANLLTSGKLLLSNQPSDTSSALYTYEASSGNNAAALSMANLNQRNVYFQASGNLPSISISFNGYSANLVGSVAASALQATDADNAKKIGMDGLQILFQKSAGVNSDEELARIIELQNNFAASAKVIGVIQKLFDILAQAI